MGRIDLPDVRRDEDEHQVTKFCAESGCRTRVALSRRRCVEHQAALDQRDNQRRHGKRRSHGRGVALWSNLRAARLELDLGLCQFKRQGCTVIATTVHLDERMQGRHDLATIDDCTSACSRCHGRVDAPRAAVRQIPRTASLDRPRA